MVRLRRSEKPFMWVRFPPALLAGQEQAKKNDAIRRRLYPALLKGTQLKSKEWAVKFAPAGDGKLFDKKLLDEVLTEYALETRELIDARTKNSKPESKAAASDGALREQKQKFLAVSNQVKWLLPEFFDEMVVTHLNDTKTLVDKWKASTKKKEEDKQEKVVGRNIVKGK